MRSETPPTFNGPKFGGWLGRWMDTHDIQVQELATASGLAYDTVTILRRGFRRGGDSYNVNVNTLARLAWGLGLPLSYVAAQAGLGDEGGRWDEFSPSERQVIARRLCCEPDDLDRTLREIVRSEGVE